MANRRCPGGIPRALDLDGRLAGCCTALGRGRHFVDVRHRDLVFILHVKHHTAPFGSAVDATPLWGPVWQFGSMHDRPPKGAFGCPSEPWTCFGTGNEWLQHDWNVEQLE